MTLRAIVCHGEGDRTYPQSSIMPRNSYVFGICYASLVPIRYPATDSLSNRGPASKPAFKSVRQQAGTIMSMAINRISASGVAAMLYPVMKPNRVPKTGTDRKTTSSQAAVQGASEPAGAPRTVDQIQAAFESAKVALGRVATDAVTQPNPEVQSGGLPQSGAAYAQGEQQAGQVLDVTA